MRLALQLGRTLDELLRTISSRELSMWLARERIEPLDDPYWRSAMQASTEARLAGHKVKVTDFLPITNIQTNQTPDDHIAILKAVAAPP